MVQAWEWVETGADKCILKYKKPPRLITGAKEILGLNCITIAICKITKSSQMNSWSKKLEPETKNYLDILSNGINPNS